MIDAVDNLPHSVNLRGTNILKKQATLTRGLLSFYREYHKKNRLVCHKGKPAD